MEITNEYIRNYYTVKRIVDAHIPDNIKQYLDTRFSEGTYRLRIVTILNGLNEIPKCPICGNILKLDGRDFNLTCGDSKCIYALNRLTFKSHYGVDNAFQLDSVKLKIKETNLERYGVDNPAKSKETWDKIKATNLERYGTEYGLSNESVKLKRKLTCILKYGVDNIAKLLEILDMKVLHNLERYGVEYTTLLLSTIDKIHDSKTKNKTHSCSKEEDKVYLLLKNKFDNVERQYKSELYPFSCDFYIPDIKLYIECNFHWTHGKHPFNKDNKEDIEKLLIWKNRLEDKPYYKDAIDVWINRDIKKRNIAKENKLNYLEFFCYNDLESYFNNLKTF